ncbi:mono/diheme cytochrome c family protein [Methylobacterium sp. PvP062]|uniref:Mono/diheme cytochrome c family protein n=1 Tax=Methylobacterium radiotolerans TaxID=31998 RepID=A0ABV2NBX3_9HYPH|nr:MULTISPECIES: cytochrome C552 [unclassified Methylobacterium]MBP2492801.1 mono/diheme cytochrome c family protein [Methylobacterium sp. PvP105]MBP2500827.1 mono/diheme cytochrome c family protein [Methylobacterium sp. PvP109]MCX7336362.1 cytochrome C552 [Hyphomicrobiales bacterium]
MTFQSAASHAAVLAASLAACAGAPAAGPEEDHRVRGWAIAAQHCSECHVIGRTSQPGAFAGPAFLRVANMPSTTGPALAVFLQSHHQRMPSLRLDRDEMDAVIDYILSLKARTAATPPGITSED